jgi:hypothetical protein
VSGYPVSELGTSGIMSADHNTPDLIYLYLSLVMERAFFYVLLLIIGVTEYQRSVNPSESKIN